MLRFAPRKDHMEDTTQETVVDGPTFVENPETTETAGVEQAVETPTDKPQEPETAGTDELDKQAEESLFKTLASKKGLDPNDPSSIEKIAKMAMEAESNMTRKAQEVAQMEKLIEALIDEEVPEEAPTVSDPVEAPMSSYNPVVAKLEAKDDMRTVADMHPDFYDYAEGMGAILEGNPSAAFAFKGPRGVELLYRMAKAEAMDKNLAQARQEGRQEVTEKEVEKLRAQVASGTKAKRSESPAFTREQIAAHQDDIPWLEANMPEIERQMKAGLIE